jgi:hypothetical protein
MGTVRVVIKLERRKWSFIAGNAIADFLDRRSDDGRRVLGMTEFEMHTAADVLQLEHGTSPGGAGDGDLDGLRAELGMAGEQGFTSAEKHGGVAMMHGLNLENSGGWKVVEKNAAFDFRLDDTAVDLVRQIGMRIEHRGYAGQLSGHRVLGFW